jgi:hypothetical protein
MLLSLDLIGKLVVARLSRDFDLPFISGLFDNWFHE